MEKIKKIVVKTHIGDFGQLVDSFLITISDVTEGELKKVKPENFKIDNNYSDLTGKTPSEGVISINLPGENQIEMIVDPFIFRYNFSVAGKIGKVQFAFTKENIKEIIVKDIEKFNAYHENGVNYRLYEPEGVGARPLVLFLHGGGECGEDNEQQLTGTIGAIRLAERWSDMYIMAPQAPAGAVDMNEMFEIMKKRGNPFTVDMGITPFSLKGERGWNRDYVGRVCDIVRQQIAEGKADPNRIYLIGMSMGGGGVLQTLSVAPDLFASAVAICPSMNGESYANLLNLPEIPVWIATAYIDHQHGRHAHILNACNKLWQEGRNDVKYTIYTPEELAEYGIGITEDLSYQELCEENHNSWILVMHNEMGILDWMISRQKNKKYQ